MNVRNVAVLSLFVGAAVVGCSSDPAPSATPGSTTAGSTASAGVTSTIGGPPGTGVIASDDPRADQILSVIEAAVPELAPTR